MATNYDLQQTGEQVQQILNSAPEMEERTKDTTVININAMSDSESTYTLETAIAALGAYEEENNVTYRKSGLVLTYKTANNKWESKQFQGNDVEDFDDESLWTDFGSGKVEVDVDTTNKVFAIKDGKGQDVGTITVGEGVGGSVTLTLADGENGQSFTVALPNLAYNENTQFLEYIDANGEHHNTVKLSNLQIKGVFSETPSSGDWGLGDLILVGSNSSYDLKVYDGESWQPLGSINSPSLQAKDIDYNDTNTQFGVAKVQGAIEKLSTTDGIKVAGENKTLTDFVEVVESEVVKYDNVPFGTVGLVYIGVDANRVGFWSVGSNNYQGFFLKVDKEKKYKIISNDENNALVFELTSNVYGATNDVVTTFAKGSYDDSRTVVLPGTSSIITPSLNTEYFYVATVVVNNRAPKRIMVLEKSLNDELQSLTNSFNEQSVITDNKIERASLLGYKKEYVPLDVYVNAYITGAGKWLTTDSNYKGYLIPFDGNKDTLYKLTPSSNGPCRIFALLNNERVNDTTPSFVTGEYESSRRVCYVGDSAIVSFPEGTKYLWVQRQTEEYGDCTPIIEKLTPVDGEIIATLIHEGKLLTSTGTFVDATASAACTYEYIVKPSTKYVACGYSPSDADLTKVGIVCTDAEGNVLECYKPTRSAAFKDYEITTPENCHKMFIFGMAFQQPKLKEYSAELENVKIDSIPQIYNGAYKTFNGTTLKILCFGSSWFMTTWWYLNKLLGAANIDCELHCYYMGHAKMREWLDFYNGLTTPFSGDESSRRASKNISVNGADWTVSTYSATGSYNATSFKNDFVDDIKSGDWDIIAFQQGAQECIIKGEWDVKNDVIKMIKENCSYKTTIAFNATFAPALSHYLGDYFPSISRSAYGKKYFQYLNNRYTKLFMAETGIENVSPNGAMLSLMRADNSLNLSNDMANDGLHPNNGLPILGICGCFYETFIAPIIGVSFDELDWLPTASTQKATVSGNSFQACSAEQLETLKKYVKIALANRFKYYE